MTASLANRWDSPDSLPDRRNLRPLVVLLVLVEEEGKTENILDGWFVCVCVLCECLKARKGNRGSAWTFNV